MNTEALLSKFDLLTDIPDAIGKLRHLIITLAVRGSLSTRRGDDGDARDLFPQIPPSIDSRFPVPESWRWVPFSAVGEQRLGKMLDVGGNRGELKPYLRNKNVQWFAIHLDDVKELRLDKDEQDEYRLRDGDLLICEGGEPGRSAVWRESDLEMYFQKAIHRVRPLKGICADYLALCLSQDAQAGALEPYFTGATIKHFTGRSLSRYSVPLPPASEQLRIVDKVDELMALCDRLDAQQREREGRRSALTSVALAEFFAKPTSLNLQRAVCSPSDASPAQLRELVLTLAVKAGSAGAAPQPLGALLAEASINGVSKGPSEGGGTEILRISAGTAARNFFVEENDFKHVDLSAAEVAKFRLEPEDLLACRYNGNLRYVGRFSYYRGQSGRKQVNPDKLIRFRLNKELCCPRYVCFAMNAPPTRVAIESMCATTAGNIGVSAGRLKSVQIPIPTLIEQRRIAARVDGLLNLIDTLEAQLQAAAAKGDLLLNASLAELCRAGTGSHINGLARSGRRVDIPLDRPL